MGHAGCSKAAGLHLLFSAVLVVDAGVSPWSVLVTFVTWLPSP